MGSPHGFIERVFNSYGYRAVFHFSLDMVAFQHKVSIGPLDFSFRGSDDAL